MWKLKTILAGYLYLDGGAMFGVVPRPLWERLNPPDERNRCKWAMRCLLLEGEGRRILIDTGIGNKQSPEFFRHYSPEGDTVEEAVRKVGIDPESITDVILTHLHFDHCGGALRINEQNEIVPTFPNAVYWSNELHWQWASNPNPRERASFLKENFEPLLKEWGRVKWAFDGQELYPGVRVEFCYGHTEAMMIVRVELPDSSKELIYMADLIPSSYHVPMPYVMAYDVRPLITLREKQRILEEAIEKGHVLFFEHDPVNECALVVRGRKYPVVSETFSLEEINAYV